MSGIGTVWRGDWRVVRRERSVWAVLALFAVVVGLAVERGGRTVAAEEAHLRALAAEEQLRLERLTHTVAELGAGRGTPPAAGQDPRSPLVVGRELGRRTALLPPGPLAAVAVGQRDVRPSAVHVDLHGREAARGGLSETRSAEHRRVGAFDLAFVFVFLLPLVVVALTYDLLSGDRERGTLALVLAQPIGLGTYSLGKAALRGSLLLAVVLGLGVAMPLVAGATNAESLWRYGLYAALLLAYTAFWFALGVFVNALGRSSAANALALVGAWLALVVVVPGLLAVGVEAAHPMPSRVELVNVARAAAREAEAAVSALEGDHGEQPAPRDLAARRAVDVQAALDQQVRPVVDAFGAQLARQQSLVDRYRFLSPAVVLHEGLTEIAGSGAVRQARFDRQVAAFADAFRAFFADRVRRGDELSAADYAELPAFAFAEEAPRGVAARVAAGLLGLVIPTMLLLGAAGVRLRRGFDVGR